MLTSNYGAPRYPTESLPDSLRRVVEEIKHNVNAPDALIAMTVLGVASTACQGLAVVETPLGRELSLNLLQCVTAESGEGKTGITRVAAKGIMDHDAARATAYKQAVQNYRAHLATWQARHRGLHARLTALTRDGKPSNDAATEVEHHEHDRPVQPRLRQTIRRDMTERALVDTLAGDGESILLLADEGNILLQNRLLTHPSLLSGVWDGIEVSLDRARGETVIATRPRVSVLLMPQPPALREFMGKYATEAVDGGLLSRCLLWCTTPTHGTRYIEAGQPLHEQTDKFNVRVMQLLREYDGKVAGGQIQYKKVHLSSPATNKFYEISNSFEASINYTEYGYLGRSFARKASEHSLRLAGIFCVFDGREAEITADQLERATTVISAHATQFVTLASALAEPALLQSQVKQLVSFLKTHVWDRQLQGISKTELLHSGPWSLRTKVTLDRVLSILVDRRIVWLAPDGRKRQSVWLNAALFSSFFAMYGQL